MLLAGILLVLGYLTSQCHVDTPQSTSSAPSIPKTRVLSPCTLATDDQVKEALGHPLAGSSEVVEAPSYSNCNYWDASRTRMITVSGLPHKVELSAIPGKAVNVGGIGDLAVYEPVSGGGRLSVDSGTAAFAVTYTSYTVDDNAGLLAQAKLMVLARSIVARL
ncbi:hypothetical protein CFP65_1571 [Kitasatospora sp. MMS16-BH015]|nr:hypothetical protein CFP65_1571 [Kitasatospora sp. MMS16-BH015]